MSQQRKLSRHNSKQSSIGETASVGSTKSGKSNGSSEYSSSLSNGHQTISNGSKHKNNNNNIKTNGLSKHSSQESGGSSLGSQTITTSTQEVASSILNVAEMLLHGVADNEIIGIWLKSIQCEEFIAKFIDSGYDVPTLARITPQDLTAIGVTDPTKRLKILAEIKKLNLQDGIPNFMPASLSHWLSSIRLDSYYYKSLCDQNVDTIDKLCQLTWEDFEELGITKLGHQKRFQLAIERVKELRQNSNKNGAGGTGSKPISEPIYDTNPSQILLVASAENHSVNGPIINKQSSTSELSSIDSGSMHSVYSAASAHYQPNYAPLSDNQSNHTMTNMVSNQHQQQQAIYSQLPNRMLQQQQQHQHQNHPIQISPVQQQQSHYQAFQNQQPIYQQQVPQQNGTNQYMSTISNPALNQSNRQSLGQLPFSSLAKLTKHQQQMLQQSSIYATLSRQPARAKQPPPPVPIRTNSLKSDSLIDDTNVQLHHLQQHQHPLDFHNQFNDFRMAGGRTMNNRNQFSSHTMLTKNKSFSGSAHMDASRARFLNRNSQQIQQQQPMLQPHHFQVPPSQAPQISPSQPIQMQQQQQCNATTGKDDEFPPPPSPLTQTDFDEQQLQQAPPPPQQLDIVSLNSDCNFTDVNHALMTFRVES